MEKNTASLSSGKHPKYLGAERHALQLSPHHLHHGCHAAQPSTLTVQPPRHRALHPPPSSPKPPHFHFISPSSPLFFFISLWLRLLSLQSPGALSEHYSAQHVFD